RSPSWRAGACTGGEAMWLNASASDGENGAPRRPSHSTLLRNGVKNRARELRSAATVLPARLRGFFADLGPGLVTGAADDDPSGILADPDWHTVLRATVVPHVTFTPGYIATFVGILGTTISPYLFFWQAGQEVEEERARGRRTVEEREGATDEEVHRSNLDVVTGMFVSNVVMYFIILTTAASLHARGVTEITTAQQAAEALRPLAGDWAYGLFTLGIIGTGMLSVPILAGSCAYAIAEAAAWRG